MNDRAVKSAASPSRDASVAEGGPSTDATGPGPDRGRRPLRHDLKEQFRPWILLSPALLVLLLLFVGSLVLAFLQSLQWLPVLGQTELNLDAYTSLFARREFWPSLWLTLYIGVSATVIAIVFGIGFALMLRRLSYRFRFLTFLFQINLPVPHVVSAAAITMLLAQSGTLSRLSQRVGVTDSPADFPLLIFDPAAIGILVSFSWKEVPFIAVIALAQLRSTVTDYEDVAKMLGAGPWQQLRYVTIPIIMPGVLSASVVVFAFAFGSYEVPRLLGRSFPQTLPVLAVRLHNDVDLTVRPEGMAVTVVVATITVILVALYMRLARSRIRQEGR